MWKYARLRRASTDSLLTVPLDSPIDAGDDDEGWRRAEMLVADRYPGWRVIALCETESKANQVNTE